MIHILSIGQPSPKWAQIAFDEYAKRLQGHWACQLKTIPCAKASTPAQCKQQESQKLIASLDKFTHTPCTALDPQGITMDSPGFAEHLQNGFAHSTNMAFVIGGPHGLGDEILSACEHRLSLSALTFPHVFARVILIEQIYRAWTIAQRHPYHK